MPLSRMRRAIGVFGVVTNAVKRHPIAGLKGEYVVAVPATAKRSATGPFGSSSVSFPLFLSVCLFFV